jgi:hypothetical protein
VRLDEAGEIVTILIATFHRDALEPESAVAFGKYVAERCDDPSAAFEAVGDLSRTQDRFPTFREFLDAYFAVVRRRTSDSADKRGLPSPPVRGIPEWAHVWWWARYERDPRELRSFPAQVNDDVPPVEPFLTEAEFVALAQEWREAGSPQLRDFLLSVSTDEYS